MEVNRVLPVSSLPSSKSVLPKKEKSQSQKTTPSFSEVLRNVQQRELASKIATTSKLATSPAVIGTGSALPNDYISSFEIANPTEADKKATPQGNAAGSVLARGKTIDKTSKLYEQALELESYFVKIMINSMKNTLKGDIFGKESYASKMYRDMMFDELSRTVTKNAGFGLADQIYLQLV